MKKQSLIHEWGEWGNDAYFRFCFTLQWLLPVSWMVEEMLLTKWFAQASVLNHNPYHQGFSSETVNFLKS